MQNLYSRCFKITNVPGSQTIDLIVLFPFLTLNIEFHHRHLFITKPSLFCFEPFPKANLTKDQTMTKCYATLSMRQWCLVLIKCEACLIRYLTIKIISVRHRNILLSLNTTISWRPVMSWAAFWSHQSSRIGKTSYS